MNGSKVKGSAIKGKDEELGIQILMIIREHSTALIEKVSRSDHSQ
jgi:hypothetical protein